MVSYTPLPLAELKKLRKPLRNINREHQERLTPLEKFAVWITKHVGSMRFFLFIVGWTVSWIGWNLFTPDAYRFDPFPAFVLWLFISNMIQILLMPLILVGQNLQGRHLEARAEVDYDVNIKVEREIEAIVSHLEQQNDILAAILKKIERK